MVREEIRRREKILSQKRAENELLERQARKSEEEVLQTATDMQSSMEALVLLEEVANSRRGAVKGRIESVLTEALQLVYNSSRSIELDYSVKNNRSHLAFELVKDTPAGVVRRTLDGTGSGLGVSDTVSVPLRLLVLLGKHADKICVLDECYKHVSIGLVPVVTKFLRVLTERLSIQVVLLSHHESVRADADAAYEVKEVAGVSTVCRV